MVNKYLLVTSRAAGKRGEVSGEYGDMVVTNLMQTISEWQYGGNNDLCALRLLRASAMWFLSRRRFDSVTSGWKFRFRFEVNGVFICVYMYI